MKVKLTLGDRATGKQTVLEGEGSGLIVSIEGYEDFIGTPDIIVLDETGSGLDLHVWADKGYEDATHVISLKDVAV